MLFFPVEQTKLKEQVNVKFFATLFLNNAIPNESLLLLKKEFDQKLKQYRSSDKEENQIRRIKKVFFSRFDGLLDHNIEGPHWLAENDIAQLVMDRLMENHGYLYDLICYTIMPNHIHLLCDFQFPVQDDIHIQWDDLLTKIKDDIAEKANVALQKNDKFWETENYNHQVHNDSEMVNIISYVVENPVKAGLVDYWKDWPFTFVNSHYIR